MNLGSSSKPSRERSVPSVKCKRATDCLESLRDSAWDVRVMTWAAAKWFKTHIYRNQCRDKIWRCLVRACQPASRRVCACMSECMCMCVCVCVCECVCVCVVRGVYYW